jgi:hypothetical protein
MNMIVETIDLNSKVEKNSMIELRNDGGDRACH